jgi:8-oxo-dGTP pyrophosphatase MutT (NUDIX family)
VIARLLSAAVPGDATEREHLTAMWELARLPSCCARDHWDPGHFTASAFVLSPDAQRLALVHHGKLKRWLQPGGHVEPSDADLLAAARREVGEEIGLVDLELLAPAPFDLDVHVIPARGDQPEHRHFDVRFLFRSRSLALRAGSDALDARWVPLTEVHEHESDASVMRAVARITAQQGDHRVVQDAVRREG